MKTTVKPSDIVPHGRNDNGYYVFTCYGLNLGQYSIGGCRNMRDAKRAALDYFNEQAKKA
jgi:hypothetical protein